MKKLLLFFALIMVTVTAFCQGAVDQVKDILVSLGAKPVLASTVAFLLVTFIGLKLIPNKWAATTLYLEKLCAGIAAFLHLLNEKYNTLSAKQNKERLDNLSFKSALQVEQDRIMKAHGYKKPLITVALLFIGLAFMNAQSPAQGFFSPLGKAVNQGLFLKANDNPGQAVEKVMKLRTSFAITAYAVELSEKNPVATSMSGAGIGVSYGEYEMTLDNKPYCKYSVNLALLTTMEFAGSTDAHIGFSLTGDAFNKIIGFGPGVYFDAGKPKWLLLFNVSVPL